MHERVEDVGDRLCLRLVMSVRLRVCKFAVVAVAACASVRPVSACRAGAPALWCALCVVAWLVARLALWERDVRPGAVRSVASACACKSLAEFVCESAGGASVAVVACKVSARDGVFAVLAFVLAVAVAAFGLGKAVVAVRVVTLVIPVVVVGKGSGDHFADLIISRCSVAA